MKITNLKQINWRSIKFSWRQIGLFTGLAGAIIISQLTLLWAPTVGVYLVVVAAAALIGLALLSERLRQLAIVATVLPITMMVALSLPQSSNLAELTVFYVALLVLSLVYRALFLLDEPLADTQLKLCDYVVSLGMMTVIGEALGVIGYALLRHHYSFGHASLPLVAVSAGFFAIVEEFFFRGLLQNQAAKIFKPATAAVLTTIIYTSASVGHITVWAPLFSLLLGATLSYIYYKKNNLLLTITVNLSAKLVYIGLMAGFIFRH